MKVTCSGKPLKQPIEFDIPKETLDEIEKLNNPQEQNLIIVKLALKHIKKFGYDFGLCSERNKSVDFNFCINCGLKQNLTKTKWEECKAKNINYKYPMSSMPTQATKEIKDEKIRKTLELSPKELQMAKDLFITN